MSFAALKSSRVDEALMAHICKKGIAGLAATFQRAAIEMKMVGVGGVEVRPDGDPEIAASAFVNLAQEAGLGCVAFPIP